LEVCFFAKSVRILVKDFQDYQCLLSCRDYQCCFPFTFSRLLQSSLAFKDYHSLLVCRDNQGRMPLYLFKDYQSFLLCRDNQGYLSLYFSKTSMSFDKDYHSLLCLKTIKYVGLQRRSRLSAPLHFEDFNVFRPRLSQSSLPPRLSSIQVCWPPETIKVICLFSKTSISFDQDYHCLLCLKDYQVRWLAGTIKVICSLRFKDFNVFCQDYHSLFYILKTIKVCHHAKTIMVICFLYFSKTIKVCYLEETINVFRPLHFQRPSESFVSKTIKVFC